MTIPTIPIASMYETFGGSLRYMYVNIPYMLHGFTWMVWDRKAMGVDRPSKKLHCAAVLHPRLWPLPMVLALEQGIPYDS